MKVERGCLSVFGILHTLYWAGLIVVGISFSIFVVGEFNLVVEPGGLEAYIQAFIEQPKEFVRLIFFILVAGAVMWTIHFNLSKLLPKSVVYGPNVVAEENADDSTSTNS